MAAVAPSFQDLLDQGVAEAQSRRPDLQFRDGDVTEAMMHGAGAMSDATIRYSAQLFRNTFLDGASGADLTSLVSDRTGLVRDPATPATASVAFTRSAMTGPGGTIAAGTKVATGFDASGKQIVFTTDSGLSFALNEVGPKSVNVTASEAGSGGNVAASTIVQILGALFDTFTVTNAAEAAGGNEEESDDALKLRARTFYLTLRRGTLDALEFGALTVPAVRVATAVEDPDTGDVTVRVTDEDGNSNTQMINDVEAELENWRAAGVNVNVIGGEMATLDMTITLVTVADGFSTAAAAATIAASVAARINRLRVGGTLYLDSVIGAVTAVAPDEIFDVSFSAFLLNGSPLDTGDVVPTAIQLLRAGTITVQ